MERREYFRIEQKLGIHYRALPEEHLTNPYDESLKLPATLTFINQIHELDHETSLTLKKIQTRQSDIGRYLKNMNQRLHLLEMAIFNLDTSYPKIDWRDANYSETGIGFKVFESLPPDLKLHLILAIPNPDNPKACHWLSLISSVISCDQIEPDKSAEEEKQIYQLGLSFKYVSDFDKQYLARHILRVQSIRRRNQLEADD